MKIMLFHHTVPKKIIPILATTVLAVFSTLVSSCRHGALGEFEDSSVWYVNPTSGSDSNLGLSEADSFKSFGPLNRIKLGAGDRVIVYPGTHQQSLVPMAAGSAEQPAVIRFLPGVHEFAVKDAVRRQYFISNSVAAAEKPMPIGVLIKNCRHLLLEGAGTRGENRTTLLMGGRMTHFVNDESEDIRYRKMVFDLKRPTVSEFRVTASGETWSDIRIAEGSTCELRDGRLVWTGDLGSGMPLLQQAIPAEGRSWRTRFSNNPLDHASRVEALGPSSYRLHFVGREPLKVGHQFQYRNGMRDVVGAHNVACKDISFQDVDFNALAGMGIISQFTEDITFERVNIVPPENTLRTCPAWADGFHFSGCRGQISIEDCVFSGLQDDPVNVHGTHLRIIDKPRADQLLVRFMHKQTYGFKAFYPGDEVAVIHAASLREHPDNPRRIVTSVQRMSDHEWLLTLDGEAPHYVENDVVDNISWYPDLTIRGCRVDMCPTRGFLVTTRGKVLIEGNTLKRCRMPGILIENDASGWFESGPVRDILISDNTFIGCDIRIHPRVKSGNEPVHDNIRIIGNTFKEGASIEGHHVSNVVVRGNQTDGEPLEIKLDPESTSAEIGDNE